MSAVPTSGASGAEPRTSAETARLEALAAMVEADPSDATARLLLGVECLGAGRCADAARHLSAYVEAGDREGGDTGAAYLSLARAKHAVGDRAGALAAIETGVLRAKAHRHLQLAASLEAERAAWTDADPGA